MSTSSDKIKKNMHFHLQLAVSTRVKILFRQQNVSHNCIINQKTDTKMLVSTNNSIETYYISISVCNSYHDMIY
jgi:P pilus assembly chaperone PapD